MNRAFDGDVVAVELLPQSLLPGSQAVKIADRDGEYKKKSFLFLSHHQYC
jgi:hypothetical protein